MLVIWIAASFIRDRHMLTPCCSPLRRRSILWPPACCMSSYLPSEGISNTTHNWIHFSDYPSEFLCIFLLAFFTLSDLQVLKLQWSGWNKSWVNIQQIGDLFLVLFSLYYLLAVWFRVSCSSCCAFPLFYFSCCLFFLICIYNGTKSRVLCILGNCFTYVKSPISHPLS